MKKRNANTSADRKNMEEIPLSVQVISIIGVILGLVYSFASVIMFIFGRDRVGVFKDLFFGNATGFELGFLSFVILLFGVFLILVSNGLWRRDNLARYLLISVLVISAVSSVLKLSLGSGIGFFNLMISFLVIYYLAFDKKVKKYFRKV